MSDDHAKAKPVKDWVGLQVRISNKIRQQLFASAASNKVSMNAELVNRLEQSFLRDDGPVDETTASLFQAIRRVISKIEHITGQRWHADQVCFEAVRKSLEAIYSDFRPPLINEAEVMEISNSINDQQRKIDGILDMLENWGIISSSLVTHMSSAMIKFLPSPSEGKFDASKNDGQDLSDIVATESMSLESRQVYNTLLFLGRRVLVPLDSPADQWELKDNDKPGAPDIAFGARAMMAGLVRLKVELDGMKAKLKELSTAQYEAEEQGKLIAGQIRDFRTASSVLGSV